MLKKTASCWDFSNPRTPGAGDGPSSIAAILRAYSFCHEEPWEAAMHRPFSLHSKCDRPPLRVGVLLDSYIQPAWVAEILEDIARSNFARIELAVINAETKDKQPGVMATLRDAKGRANLLFRLYARWDRRQLKAGIDPFCPTDCSAFLRDAESIRVIPARKGFVHRFTDQDVNRVREKNLDVLLRFGFNILRGEILTAASCGVWSFHHGDNEFYRGGPAYFWELVEGNYISGALLQVLTEELDAGKVLCKGFFATRRGLSLSRNRVQPYWGASGFMMHKLHQLHEFGWARVAAQIVASVPYRGKVKLYRAPANGQMARWLGPAIVNAAIDWLMSPMGRMALTHWELAVRHGSQLPYTKFEIAGFRWLKAPRGHFQADPFLFMHGDRRWLFFEDYDYAARRACIACAEVLADGRLAASVTVLTRPYHLSYPCVFSTEDGIYMIPETRGHGTVELYRCRSFPDAWEFVQVLLDAQAVDTTVWCEAGLCWFFVTLREPRDGALQLWLFYSTSVTAEWVSHPANPISTDARSSRGAGAIYRESGKLIRPSQDCSKNYGRSFTLNEILLLNREEYCERALCMVEAPKGFIGTHTYAKLDDLEVIDGCARRSFFKVLNWRLILSRLRDRFGQNQN
jgi:hypothetical protein